ncbi:MAG: O-antigen ligase family protein [Chitinophagaceae bacterium]
MFTQKLPLHFISIIFYCLLLAIVGSFVSNALLSISISILSICGIGYFIGYGKFSIFNFCLIVLVSLSFFSIFWSSNAQEAWQRSIVKLPLLIMAIPLKNVLNKTQFKVVLISLCACISVSIVLSLINYISNYNLINEAYKRAKVMPIYFGGDHIRFSWLIVISMLLVFHSVKYINHKLLKKSSIIYLVFSFIFLHILAAKTGLLCLYVAIIFLTLAYLKKYTKQTIIALTICIGLIIILFTTSQSFKNRVGYIFYDIENIKNGNFISGLSDGARILSWKAAISIGSNHALYGVGFGDLKTNIEAWHQQYHPLSQPYEMFITTNQFLIYYAAMGVIGVILFSACISMLLFYKNKHNFSNLYSLILLIPLITDDSFERQHGIFVFAVGFLLASYLMSIKTKETSNATLKPLN